MDNEASSPENQEVQKTSFWNFLKGLDKIEIPIIQRDYAQGREGEEYSKLRRRFIKSLKHAMDSGEQLNLDFIYGSYDKDRKKVKILQPLDGQQRLTTLWLLHWYIALRAGKLKENCEVLERFTYETRISSREFCQSLCRPENFNSFDGEEIVDFIENQRWFYSVWKQEPTIQSMLRMLGETGADDGITGVFKGKKDFYEKCWNDLTPSSSRRVPIVFYYTPLENFGLSDDLYVKMNARGKQLTPFENFKADLITYLRNEDKDLYEDISKKLDNNWANIFWENKSDEKICGENKIDEIYFAFLNRFFWNELFIAKNPETKEDLICFEGDKLKSCNKGDRQESYNSSLEHLSNDAGYSGMDTYKFLDGRRIPTKLFKDLRIVLDRYKAYMDLYKKLREDGENPLSDLVSKEEWDDNPSFPDIFFPKWVREDFEFIPKYKYGQNGEEISMLKPPSKRVMFYALCKYFKEEKIKGEDTTQPPPKKSFVALKQWMRVVCNLVSGRDTLGHILIREDSTAKSVIKYIEELDSQSVLEDLISEKRHRFDDADSAFKRQWNEEIIKAKQILDDGGKNLRPYETGKTWEDVIIDAEEYAFFKGAIRFLFQGEDGKEDWDNFDTKLKYAKNYFKGEVKEEDTGENRSSCLKNDDEMKLLKALISKLDAGQFDNALFKDHKVFNNRSGSWRYYLLNSSLCAPIHELLLGDKGIKNPLDLKEESYKGSLPMSTIKDILYLLSQTTLLNYIAENIPDAWIRAGYHNHYAIYRKKGGGVFLSAKGRDSFFKKNAPKIKLFDENIIIDKNIEGRYLLSVPNVYFDYFNDKGEKVGHFLWCEDEYIYLQEPDGENRDTSLVKDANENSPDHWYRVPTKSSEGKDLSNDEILNSLGELKGAYEKANPPSNS